MKLTKLTKNEILENKVRNYNPKEWTKTVERFAKYADVEFYIAPAQEGYSYDRFYAVYTTEEGIRFMNDVSYGACLSDRGFCQVFIWTTTGELEVIKFGPNRDSYLNTTKEARKFMAAASQSRGAIFSKLF